MDAHSSSLLSPIAPAPDKLAEERSALSQVYSDSHSVDPDLVNPDPSSLQPLRSPHVNSQDTTPITDESILIAKIVDDLKNLAYVDLFRKKSLKFRENFIKIRPCASSG